MKSTLRFLPSLSSVRAIAARIPVILQSVWPVPAYVSSRPNHAPQSMNRQLILGCACAAVGVACIALSQLHLLH